MGKINYRDKRFSYLVKGVEYGVPPEIKHKGIVYKFATPLYRIAIELHDAGKKILCLRTMKTKELTLRQAYNEAFGAPISPRNVLEELYYSNSN
jgi:hypothetical protein